MDFPVKDIQFGCRKTEGNEWCRGEEVRGEATACPRRQHVGMN